MTPRQGERQRDQEKTRALRASMCARAPVPDGGAPASPPGLGRWAGAPVGLAPHCPPTVRTLRPRDGQRVVCSKGT